MNFSEKRKTYYEYYRTALKLMFPIKIMHQLTMAPFNHRICFGRSKTCTMVERKLIFLLTIMKHFSSTL